LHFSLFAFFAAHLHNYNIRVLFHSNFQQKIPGAAIFCSFSLNLSALALKPIGVGFKKLKIPESLASLHFFNIKIPFFESWSTFFCIFSNIPGCL